MAKTEYKHGGSYEELEAVRNDNLDRERVKKAQQWLTNDKFRADIAANGPKYQINAVKSRKDNDGHPTGNVQESANEPPYEPGAMVDVKDLKHPSEQGKDKQGEANYYDHLRKEAAKKKILGE